MGGVVLLVENGSHDFSTQPQLPSYHPERKKLISDKKSRKIIWKTRRRTLILQA